MGYPNLYARCGWKPGVHRAPVGYQHPWLAVTEQGTSGHWSRAEAREAYRLARRRMSECARGRFGSCNSEGGQK